MQTVVSGTASTCGGQSSSSFVVDDRCVGVITDVITYFEARALCRRRGRSADLVQLKTENANAEAADALRTYVNSTHSGFWIGLTMSDWSWESGKILQSTKDWQQKCISLWLAAIPLLIQLPLAYHENCRFLYFAKLLNNAFSLNVYYFWSLSGLSSNSPFSATLAVTFMTRLHVK